MAYSYKTYSDMKDVMKKFVNASEGSVIYSLGKTRFMTLVLHPSQSDLQLT